jgi:hypothetical protein
MLVMIVYFSFIFLSLKTYSTLLYVSLLLSAIIALFSTLTTSVNDKELKIKFGIGIIHKELLISEIESLIKIKTKWYYGWGIRITPTGWLYNVSGFDAIEIKMKNGKIYKIGTDEIDKLENVISEAMKNINRGI